LSATDDAAAATAAQSAVAPDCVIDARELRKSYGDRVAVGGISIQVCAGEIVGLLGPNGAGKTTTLGMLAGVAEPAAGSIRIGGIDLHAQPIRARRLLGYVPQSIAIYPSLTAIENLIFFGRIQGLSAHEARDRAHEMLAAVGLADRERSRTGDFSGGMQRRLNIACGIIHDPAAIFLDEPTVGVDPQSRNLIFDVVAATAARGAAVLYSSHYMEEIERMCSRAILIDSGKVIAAGTIAELIALGRAAARVELVTRSALPAGWAEGIGIAVPIDSDIDVTTSLELARIDQIPDVIRRVESAGASLVEFRLHRPNLQDAFLRLTGHALRDRG
jgi:ABC-2 type transport system ATP-binding protein